MTRKHPDGQTFLFDEAVPELKGRGLIFDYFAGAGGASTGIEWALGRSPDVAINHCEHAVRVHALNHPDTDHVRVDVWDVDPRRHLPPGDVDVAWFSPDCTQFSRAKGSTPVKKSIRGLAWVVLRVAARRRPRVIFIENVPEFREWGPVRKRRFGRHRGKVSKDRFGLVTVRIDGETYAIVDIGLRMLTPRELARAQGFTDDFQLVGTQTDQVARIGNSVCPPLARALVAANV